jgi:putative transposase
VNLITTRIITATLTDDGEGVMCDLDSLARSGSKIWNVARWTAGRIWEETGDIPDEGPRKSDMRNQLCWRDLNAQSSQVIIEPQQQQQTNILRQRRRWRPNWGSYDVDKFTH